MIEQAQPNDVVVIHFSGHGNLLQDPSPISSHGCNGSIVPQDGESLPDKTVSHIMGRSIFLLMSALKTDNVSFVLDSCFSGAGTRGNLSIRSGNDGSCHLPSEEEVEFQSRLLSELGWSEADFRQQRIQGTAKGAVMASTQPQQLAFDYPFDNGAFNAGLFTYVLTQYLWEQTNNPSFARTIVDVSNRMRVLQRVEQRPVLDTNPESNRNSPFYFADTAASFSTAAVRRQDGRQLELWLGGIQPEALTSFRAGSQLIVKNSRIEEGTQVEILSRNGLTAIAQLVNDEGQVLPSDGDLLQDKVRQLPAPNELNLRIGLDSSLGSDFDIAQVELQKLERVDIISLGAGEIDYILGKVTPEYKLRFDTELSYQSPPIDSIGLMSSGLWPALSGNSFGNSNESIFEAINRLKNRLSILLSVKLLRSMSNFRSSQIPLEAKVLIDNDVSYLYQTGHENQENAEDPGGFIVTEPGQLLSIQIENAHSTELHITIIVINSDADLIVLFPNNWDKLDNTLKPASAISLPDAFGNFRWEILGPAGSFEIFLIAGTSPLERFSRSLQTAANNRDVKNLPLDLEAEELTNSIENLLSDLQVNGSNVENFTALPILIEVQE